MPTPGSSNPGLPSQRRMPHSARSRVRYPCVGCFGGDTAALLHYIPTTFLPPVMITFCVHFPGGMITTELSPIMTGASSQTMTELEKDENVILLDAE